MSDHASPEQRVVADMPLSDLGEPTDQDVRTAAAWQAFIEDEEPDPESVTEVVGRFFAAISGAPAARGDQP